MPDELKAAYEAHGDLLHALATRLEKELRDAFDGLPHVDRIHFRVKDVDSFVKKATDPENDPPYEEPLVEIEDQVAGRVIVFFLSDIQAVTERLK